MYYSTGFDRKRKSRKLFQLFLFTKYMGCKSPKQELSSFKYMLKSQDA